MKKTPLVFFILTSTLLVGCNKNSSLSFNNPFPEDSYNKVGFNFKNDEIAKTPLTTAAKDILTNTISKKDDVDALIKSCVTTVHERDYMRAFAGIFKQGYNSSNVMVEETINTYRQEEATAPTALKKRKWSEASGKKTVDYSYGKLANDIAFNTYFYMGKKTGSTLSESDTYNGADRLATQTLIGETDISHEVIADNRDGTDPEKWTKGSSTQPIYEKDVFNIKQSDYIFSTSECTVPAGSNGDSVILVKETKEQHKKDEVEGGETGRLVLQDKKKFLAMDNSLTITKLKKQTDATIGDYYLATYVREYKETVVTSEEIQPNIQITMLANPVVVKYSEVFHEFKLTGKTSADNPIQPFEEQ